MKARPPQPRRRLQGFHPPLTVSRFISTKRGDAERGPKVWIHSGDARLRLLEHGELVWVFGPHRTELAELAIDDGVPNGYVVARDVAGIATAETVHVVKPDTDSPRQGNRG